jgi:branched-chain amino acid transport system substrate-binding protein
VSSRTLRAAALGAALAVAATTAVAVGSAATTAAKPLITIGAVIDVTGPFGGAGKPEALGIRLAVSQANGAGGVAGHKLGLQLEDTGGSIPINGPLVLKVAQNNTAVAVIGPGGTSMQQTAAPAMKQAGIVGLGFATAVLDATYRNGWWLRMPPLQPAAFPELLAALQKQHPFKTVAVVYNSLAGSQVQEAQQIKDNADKLGYKVTVASGVPSTQLDYSTFVTQIRSDPPDVVWVGTVGDAAISLMKQVRDAGLKAQFMGGAAVQSGALWRGAGSAGEGALTFQPFDAQSDRKLVKAFVSEYTKKFGQPPDSYAAQAYDATRVVINALRKVGWKSNIQAERQAIRAAVQSTKKLAGVSALEFNFTPDRPENLTPTYFLVRVHNGGFDTIQPLQLKDYPAGLKAVEP